MRSILTSLSVLATAAIAFAGCGGSDDNASSAAAPVEYLPAEAVNLAVVNFDATRADLDMPEDADIIDVEALTGDEFDAQSPEARLFNAATIAVPPARQLAQTLAPTPLAEALDGGAISAAAQALAGSPQGVGAIETTQSFDELAETLAGDGYERDGDVLTNPDEEFGEIADAGDGVWLIGDADAEAGLRPAELAESKSGGPTELVELLAAGDEDAPIGVAASFANQDPSGELCIVAFGGHENPEGTAGDFILEVEGDADPDRVRADALDFAETGEPSVDGSTVTLPFTAEGGIASNPVGNVLAQFGFAGLYDCG